jgi:thioesterase domain-containing protein
MAHIEKRLGHKLPLATLFHQGATIEHLASLLRLPGDWTFRSPLVGIQPGGSQRPFFCVHPVGGNVLCYAGLARHLGPDQPFYGLQHPGLYGALEPFTRIETMAMYYLDAIRAVQPEGPYLLGGWSLGSIIAFEMARQLRAQGQAVAALVLLDPPRPTPAPPQVNPSASVVIRFARDFGLDLDVGASSREADQVWRLNPDEQLSYVLAQAQAAKLVASDVDLDQLRRHLLVFITNGEARRSYTPQTYPGRVTLLRAAERADSFDPILGWDSLAAGGVKVYTVPGDHYTLLKEPNVQVLAERLRTCLDEILSDPSSLPKPLGSNPTRLE